MANEVYSFEIAAEVTKARKAVESFSSQTQKQLDSISFSSTVSAINAGLELVGKTAGRVFNEVSGFLSDSIRESSEAEIANVRLANSLRLVGGYSQEAIEGFQKLSDEISSNTTFSDNQVISAVALAKSFQLTNKEATKLTKVASDLAIMTGVDLNSAVSTLGSTYSGVVSRDLKKFIPALKGLTDEQLNAGAAIDIIRTRVEGSAAALSNTFSGAVQKASNQFEKFKETIGDLITQNPAIIKAINLIAESFASLSKKVSDNKSNIGEILFNSFKSLLSAAPVVVGFFKIIDFVISNSILTVNAFAKGLGAVAASLVAISEGNIKTAIQGIGDIFSTLKEEVEKSFTLNSQRIDAIYNPLIAGAESASKEIEKIQFESLKKQSSAKKEQQTKDNADQLRAIDLQNQKIKERLQEIAKNPINFVLTTEAKAQLSLKITNFQKEVATAGLGFAAAALKGTEGARSLLTGAVTEFATAALGPAGAVAGEIVGVLSQGPEKTRQMVQEFARSIPQIIQNLAESLPVLIETLVTELPPALAKAMPQVALSFSVGLIANIPKIVAGFIEGMREVPKAIIDGLKKSLGNITGGLGSISGTGKSGPISGLGIPLISGLAGLVGLADGGRVPNISKFEGDKFPARLDANEQVLSSDLSEKLEAFLNGGGSNQNLVVNLQIGQQQLARAILDLNRNGFRTA